MQVRATLFVAILLVLPAPWSHAQQAAGVFSRVVVLKPKTGQAAAFAEGYQRHLDWHRNNKDPWTWHGWTFVLGDRIGQFMDGTFGHALDNFDHAVDPAADSADNNVNVTPYAEFLSHGIYERLPDASAGAALPDTTPYLALDTYIVAAGREAAFEAAIARIATDSPQRMSLYKLRIGGRTPQYVLMRPAQTFAAGGSLPVIRLPEGLVQHAQSELLRYQPQMSYAP